MRDLVATLAARTFIAAVRRYPAFDGAALGDFLWHVLPGRRRIARENVARCLPGSDTNATARASFRSFGRVIAETVRLPDVAPAIAWSDPDVLASAPAVVVSGHAGNWEIAGYAIAERFPEKTHLIVARPRERRLAALMEAHRRRIGVMPHAREESVRPVLRALRDGSLVATAADQWPSDAASVIVPFLGRPTPFALGPYRLAIAVGVPVVFIAAIRVASGYRIDTALLRGPAESVAPEEIARRFAAVLERQVAAHPDQYLWMHRRWKTAGVRR